MTANELLSKLRNLDIKIWADNGQLFCNAPKGAMTAELRAEISERKAEILDVLHDASATVQPAEPPLKPSPRDKDLPLSFAQQRLWFIDQLEPGSALYNVPTAFRICGRLSIELLEQSLNEIVRRHEVLRTTFRVREGWPAQNISANLTISLPVVDLTGRPDSKREGEALQLINEEARRPFDLADGPLLRAFSVRLAAEAHILLLTVHHIACDGWSMGILSRELSALYKAFSDARPSPLPELPIQYVDFARWQREWLQGEVLHKQVAYWKERLANLPVLQLPTDRPRPPVQSHRGERRSIVLDHELCESLKLLSQKERASIFMMLLAAFNVLLCRYSGQQDIAIGTPIAGRNRSEVEHLIGFFVNTLVLRTDLSGDPTFRELLGRVRDAALDAYTYQDLPFEKLVVELEPERNLSYSPLFQVMMVFQNGPEQTMDLAGLNVTVAQIGASASKFDLSLAVRVIPRGLGVALTYDTDLFDHDTIVRMLGHYRTLLEGIVADPNQPISKLPILDKAERHQLLVEWNDTRREYSKDKCVHELFEEQVERTPDAVAVVFEGQALTYRELNTRANQLARHLWRLGASAEIAVAICMDPSAETVVGLLGILKAGAAYLPMDPVYPTERLAFMLEESRTPVLLTQEQFLDRFAHLPIRVVAMDASWKDFAGESDRNPESGIGPRNLAYIMYTSGSAGRPKGVMVEHGSVVNYLSWVNENLLEDDVDCLPLVTTITFDMSLKQIFAPLLRGGRVWVLGKELVNDPAELLKALRPCARLALNSTPSLWQAVLAHLKSGMAGNDQIPTSLLVGGEQLSQQLVRRSLAAFPQLQLWNLYGPTEATANVSAAKIRPGEQITIGRPIANARVYILDRRLQPVPVGVAGELHVGGAGLARGYLNHSELTVERFIPNPFGNEPGSRLYKTGDLVRYLSDGNIEFLGRIDNQVKIRGFRIELGEIEVVLGQHPAVREALVVARQDSPGEKRLVGYIVTNGAVEVGALRGFLKEKLPEYMIPSAFVFLDSLPLNSNGKVDRQKLPPPGPSRPELESSFVAPRTPTEELLAKMWAELLKLEKVGIHDNFFELGGHSLLATQVVARIRNEFQIELPLRTLFEKPTIERLTNAITELNLNGSQPEAIATVLNQLESLSDEEIEKQFRKLF
jgi:amino acid adenylation domain-containing protein